MGRGQEEEMILFLFILSADIVGAILIGELGDISKAPHEVTLLACFGWGILVAIIAYVIEHHGF